MIHFPILKFKSQFVYYIINKIFGICNWKRILYLKAERDKANYKFYPTKIKFLMRIEVLLSLMSQFKILLKIDFKILDK